MTRALLELRASTASMAAFARAIPLLRTEECAARRIIDAGAELFADRRVGVHPSAAKRAGEAQVQSVQPTKAYLKLVAATARELDGYVIDFRHGWPILTAAPAAVESGARA